MNQLCIFLDFDEFQTYIFDKDTIDLRTRGDKENILIRKMAHKIMSMCSVLSNHGLFVVPIFSGTVDPSYLVIMPSTMYNVNKIFLSNLDDKSSIELIKNDPQNKDIPNSLILAMGGIPRALERLNKIASSKNWKSYNDLFDKVRYEVCNIILLIGV